MARKDEMLNAFLKNEDFCNKYDININTEVTVFESLRSKSPTFVALAKIIDKYEDDNTTLLYQQVITLLNGNL
jgi:hypothetical protein